MSAKGFLSETWHILARPNFPNSSFELDFRGILGMWAPPKSLTALVPGFP